MIPHFRGCVPPFVRQFDPQTAQIGYQSDQIALPSVVDMPSIAHQAHTHSQYLHVYFFIHVLLCVSW